MNRDEIVLTLPRRRPFYRIAHLVLGGVAVRHDLVLEHLEDLQLAVAGLLDRHEPAESVTVSVRVDGDLVRARVGPFAGEALRAELADEQREMGLRRVLDTVVDGVSIEERAGGCWVELTKTVARARG